MLIQCLIFKMMIFQIVHKYSYFTDNIGFSEMKTRIILTYCIIKFIVT